MDPAKLLTLASVVSAVGSQANTTSNTSTETPFICNPSLIKCHKDCCYRYIQFCNDEEERCTKCANFAHLCGTNDEKVGCGVFCLTHRSTSTTVPYTTTSLSNDPTSGDEDGHAVPSNIFSLTTILMGTALVAFMVLSAVLAVCLIQWKRKTKDKNNTRKEDEENGRLISQPRSDTEDPADAEEVHRGGIAEERQPLPTSVSEQPSRSVLSRTTNEENSMEDGPEHASARNGGQRHLKGSTEVPVRQRLESPVHLGASPYGDSPAAVERRNGGNGQEMPGSGPGQIQRHPAFSQFNGTGPGTAGTGDNGSNQTAGCQNGFVPSTPQPAGATLGNQRQNFDLPLASQPFGATLGNQGQNFILPLDAQGAPQLNGPPSNNMSPVPSTVQPDNGITNADHHRSSGSSQEFENFQPPPPGGMAVDVRKNNDSPLPHQFKSVIPTNDGNNHSDGITLVPGHQNPAAIYTAPASLVSP